MIPRWKARAFFENNTNLCTAGDSHDVFFSGSCPFTYEDVAENNDGGFTRRRRETNEPSCENGACTVHLKR